jgi:hypothetical protein
MRCLMSMPDSEQKNGKGIQQDLFDDSVPGAADDDPITRGILADALKRSPLSREQVAERMSWLTSRTISASMLFDFTAESKAAHRFPFAWARAFCQALNDWRLLEHMADRAGFILLPKSDADVLSLGELVVEQKRVETELSRHANNILERRTRA